MRLKCRSRGIQGPQVSADPRLPNPAPTAAPVPLLSALSRAAFKKKPHPLLPCTNNGLSLHSRKSQCLYLGLSSYPWAPHTCPPASWSQTHPGLCSCCVLCLQCLSSRCPHSTPPRLTASSIPGHTQWYQPTGYSPLCVRQGACQCTVCSLIVLYFSSNMFYSLAFIISAGHFVEASVSPAPPNNVR